jgi:hypothetical protein
VGEETTNKPDNVSDNPGILPYGSNVGAPAIKLENLQTWKDTRAQSVNKQFESRLLELKKEYDNLIEEYKWNDLVYQSKFNFEPVFNKIYHLYYSKDRSTFLSLVEPNEWNKEHIGSFRYNHDNKWIKI